MRQDLPNRAIVSIVAIVLPLTKLPGTTWRWLTFAGFALVVLDLAVQLCTEAFADSDRHSTLVGLVACVALCLLAFGAIRVCALIAARGRWLDPTMLGVGKSRRVITAVIAVVVTLFVIAPILDSIGRSFGGHGTTTQPVEHETAAIALLTVWGAVIIAPWLEEVSMRGFLLSGLTGRFGFWPAAVASSLVWAGLHGVTAVMLPFTALGISLCWARRRTGSLRTGLVIHSCINSTIYAGKVGWVVLPPVIVMLLSLFATRVNATNHVARYASAVLAAATRGCSWVADRVARPVWSSGYAWIAAGGCLAVYAVSGLTYQVSGLRIAGETTGHATVMVMAIGMGPLLWALLAAHRDNRAPAPTTVAGLVGTISLAGAIVTLEVHGSVPAAFYYGGLTLTAIAIIGLVGSRLERMTGTTAAIGGVLLAAMLAPVPYLVTTRTAFQYQTYSALLAASIALIAIGVMTWRPAPAAVPVEGLPTVAQVSAIRL